MFISQKEKNDINEAMRQMTKICDEINTNMLILIARVKVLEHGKKVVKKTSGMTPEGRAKVSAAVKAYHAKKKLEKQNATTA